MVILLHMEANWRFIMIIAVPLYRFLNYYHGFFQKHFFFTDQILEDGKWRQVSATASEGIGGQESKVKIIGKAIF